MAPEHLSHGARTTPVEAGAELLNLADAAQFLGISQRTVQRLVERGELKGTKVGRQWRFRKADLGAYVDRQPAAIPAPPEEDIRRALQSLSGWVEEITVTVAAGDAPTEEQDRPMPEAVDSMARRIVQQAIRDGVSDIHVEPSQTGMRVRFRVDGALHEMAEFPASLHPALIGWFKQSAGMSVGEHRLPQDGSFRVWYEEKEYEMRASCLTTLRGEKVVMRILDRASVLIDADRLGLSPETLAALDKLLNRGRGLFFCIGPAGSGKTTTLYCLLNRLKSPAKNIATVEDPVEYELPGTHQVAVNGPLGLTFPVAARALMRHDTDVIMVAEIRDMATLEAVLDASGSSLVLSVMHTEEAVSAVTRLLDLGLPPLSVSSVFVGALAQRLVRRLCPACKAPAPLSPTVLDEVRQRAAAGGLELPPEAVFYRATGCPQCHQTGYHGRIGLFELLEAGPAIKDATVRRAPTEELRAIAVQNGMRTLAVDGILKALGGLTTVDEVLRAI